MHGDVGGCGCAFSSERLVAFGNQVVDLG